MKEDCKYIEAIERITNLTIPRIDIDVIKRNANALDNKRLSRKNKNDKNIPKTAEKPVKGLGNHVPAFILKEVELN